MKIAYIYVNSENNEEELNVSEIEDMWFEREYGMCISSFREDICDQHCTDITREEFEKIKEKALANENLDLSGYRFYSMDDDDGDDSDEEAEEEHCDDDSECGEIESGQTYATSLVFGIIVVFSVVIAVLLMLMMFSYL